MSSMILSGTRPVNVTWSLRPIMSVGHGNEVGPLRPVADNAKLNVVQGKYRSDASRRRRRWSMPSCCHDADVANEKLPAVFPRGIARARLHADEVGP